MLTTRFATSAGALKKTFARVGGNVWNRLQRDVISAILAVLTAIGLFEESLHLKPSGSSQSGCDGSTGVIDFFKEITRQKLKSIFHQFCGSDLGGFWGAQCCNECPRSNPSNSSRRVRSGKPARVPGTDHPNYATNDGFFPRVVSDWLLRLWSFSILLVVWQLLRLAFSSWDCFRRLWLCISLWTEPLESGTPMMQGRCWQLFHGRSVYFGVQLRQF